MRFIHTNDRSVNRSRKRFTILASTVHHNMEPQKIPATRNKVSQRPLYCPIPSVARIAMNDSTVVGLVSVSRKVSRKSEAFDERPFFCALNVCGRLKK